MKKIGLLSDTHGDLNDRLFKFFANVDEIWHAGDIGNLETSDRLAAFKPLRAVYGNIDGAELRQIWPLHQRFNCEELDVWITHIGGYPGNYERLIRQELKNNPPGLFISGHSHILKVIFDRQYNLLHINPGAAGNKGFHQKITAIRFVVEGSEIRDLEIWEQDREIRQPVSDISL